MTTDIDWILTKPKFILESKLLNGPWKTAKQRRHTREISKGNRTLSYLNRYTRQFKKISIASDKKDIKYKEQDKIFSIWFQGEKNAPPIVKACFASMRTNCKQDIIILDENSLFEWIDLPNYVMNKWKKGKIRPAHFSDICRLELLYRYGGFWLDATDFVQAPLPQWIIDTDFFVYHTGDNDKYLSFYSFIQNCFIRSRKNNSLIKAWLDAILIYWQQEKKTRNYFVHQLIFKKLIECNSSAKVLYDQMPYLIQDSTHSVWFDHAGDPFDPILFDRLTKNVPFQKTEYNSPLVKNPIPNSFADIMIRMYNK